MMTDMYTDNVAKDHVLGIKPSPKDNELRAWVRSYITTSVDDPVFVPLLIQLGRQMHRESPTYRSTPFIEENLHKFQTACVDYPNTHICLAAIEADDVGQPNLVGMIGGFITPMFFNENLIAQDLFLYVQKEHRRGTTGVKLIKRFEDWAHRNGAFRIVLGISTGIDNERVHKLYNRIGYRDIGVLVMKEL